MTNSNTEREELGKVMRRQLNAEYLETYIKEPLEKTIIPSEEEGTQRRISDDHITLVIFPYIDLLGYLYRGRTSSSNAVEFMREYLGRVDNSYQEVSGLIYDAFRHGYIHLATPKRVKLRDGKILDFLFGHSGKREEFLKVTNRQELQGTGARVDVYRLSLDVPLLYRDLLSALDEYAEDIREKQELSDTFREAFETRRKPEKAKEEELLNKPYIQQSDFDFVRAQIE